MMADKKLERLWKADRLLRTLFPIAMWDDGETILTVRLYGGFEFFNTRPYHNYETWSNGWEITTGERYGNIEVHAEDLDDAYKRLLIEIEKWLRSLSVEELRRLGFYSEKHFERYLKKFD